MTPGDLLRALHAGLAAVPVGDGPPFSPAAGEGRDDDVRGRLRRYTLTAEHVPDEPFTGGSGAPCTITARMRVVYPLLGDPARAAARAVDDAAAIRAHLEPWGDGAVAAALPAGAIVARLAVTNHALATAPDAFVSTLTIALSGRG